MNAHRQQLGFGVIGMIIVVLVVGAAAVLLPRLLMTKHNQSTQLTDLQSLQAAKTAVISDALSRGVISAVGGATVACSRGIMPSTLGVNNWGVFGTDNRFCMDIADSLTGFAPSTIPVTATLCARARAELNVPVAGPRICQDSSRTTANCTASTPMAFVIYSTGNDRLPNLENIETGLVLGNPGYRIYENDLRGINNAPGTNHYDDQILSYPLASLLAECGKLGGAGGAPVCRLDPPSASTTPVVLTASVTNMPNSCADCVWTKTPPLPVFALSGLGGSVTPLVDTTYTVSATNPFGSCSASSIVTVSTELPAGYVVQGGLTWTPNRIGAAVWSNLGNAQWITANTYCTTATINGQTGWRLPTATELKSLYYSGAINGQGWKLGSTWSSTPGSSGAHDVVTLNDGWGYWVEDWSKSYVTCVR